MSQSAKKKILFIKTQESIFNYKTPLFETLFESVAFASDEHQALNLIYKKSYDFIVMDLSANIVEGITFAKQLKELKSEAEIYTLVQESDEDKIGGFIDAKIHTFVLNESQFELALETLAGL